MRIDFGVAGVPHGDDGKAQNQWQTPSVETHMVIHTVLIQEPVPKKKRKRKRNRPKKKVAAVIAPVAIAIPAPQPCKRKAFPSETVAIQVLGRIAKYPEQDGKAKPNKSFHCPDCGLWHLTVERVVCPWTSKKRFGTENQATMFIERYKDGKSKLKNHYRCSKCGDWHISSMGINLHRKIQRKMQEAVLEAVELDWDKRLYGAKHL